MMYDMTSRRSIQVIVLLLIATLALYYLPSLGISGKIIYAAICWIALFRYPFNLMKYNDLDKWSNRFIKLLLFFSVLAACNSILFDHDSHAGNLWLTMFGNQFCFLMMIVPMFAYLGCCDNMLKPIRRAIYAYIVVSICFLWYFPMYLTYACWFIPILLPYSNVKEKALLTVVFITTIFTAFMTDETSRTNIIVLLLAIINYLVVYVMSNRRLVKYYCYAIIIIPLFYTITTLLNPTQSVISIILQYVSDSTSNEDLAADSRTFLFSEMAEDLTRYDAWLFGKGAYGHYFSHTMYISDAENADSSDRLVSEVTFLQNLLRGGITYTICYYALLIWGVVKSLRHSENKLCLSIAVMMSSWMLVSFFSGVHACCFHVVMAFVLLGISISPTWLSKNNDEIKELFE